MAWAITSIYENSTTALQYPYCENIGDGRGYTAGRAGFCTGTGDAVQVVRCYRRALGGAANLMAKYYPALRALGTSADTTALDSLGPFCRDWAESASAPATSTAFNRCQDRIAADLYEIPACQAAAAWGITSALFLAELYDAWINHGSALDMLIGAGKKASVRMSNEPLSLSDESRLLDAFLRRRLDVLRSDKTWAADVDRLAPYEAARRAGNFTFVEPVDTSVKASTFWPGLGLKDSGQPSCRLAIAGDTVSVSGDRLCTSPRGAGAGM
jgi:chitosanase